MSLFRLFLVLPVLLISLTIQAQCSFTSSNNAYRVDVKVQAVSLVVHATGGDCTFDKAIIQYDIDFVSLNGTPPPSNMYTLQGVIVCNGKSMTYDLPNEGGPSTPLTWGTTGSATSGGHPFNPSHGNCSGYNVSVCDQIRVIIQGPDLSYREVVCTLTPTPLSVQLKSFDLSASDNNSVQINWTTTDELDVSHFVLEHAGEDGMYQPIAYVDANGGSNKASDYSVVHERQTSGIHFYRLTEVNTSGETNILETKAIQLSGTNSLNVYPNPTQEGTGAKLVYTPQKSKASKVAIYSSVGSLVEELHLSPQTSVHDLTLPKGHYVLHLLEDNNVVETKSLIVL